MKRIHTICEAQNKAFHKNSLSYQHIDTNESSRLIRGRGQITDIQC